MLKLHDKNLEGTQYDMLSFEKFVENELEFIVIFLI